MPNPDLESLYYTRIDNPVSGAESDRHEAIQQNVGPGTPGLGYVHTLLFWISTFTLSRRDVHSVDPRVQCEV